MLIGLITDTHYGIRNDSSIFYDYQKESNEYFLEQFKKRKIQQVIHLGDLYDRRRYVNFITAARCRTDFLDRFQDEGIHLSIMAGNHDIYYNNTNEINSLTELSVERQDKVKLYFEPTEVVFGGEKILFLPWICDSNREKSIDMIKTTDAKTVMGHLELAGYEMYKGISKDHGMDDSLFKKFDRVMSGHYHHKSRKNNVDYLGAAYEFYWSDYNDPRGVHIFDTDTKLLDFIPNPYSMFFMFPYDDTDEQSANEFLKEDWSKLKNKFVKVVAIKKNNPYLFDKFLEKIYKQNPADLNVVEDPSMFVDDTEEAVNEAEDTMTILNKYIDSIQVKGDVTTLKTLMTGIYLEATNLDA